MQEIKLASAGRDDINETGKNEEQEIKLASKKCLVGGKKFCKVLQKSLNELPESSRYQFTPAHVMTLPDG